MSDNPFELPTTPPRVSAKQARDTARYYRGFADHMWQLNYRSEARRMEQQSQWWLAYSVALAQVSPESGT